MWKTAVAPLKLRGVVVDRLLHRMREYVEMHAILIASPDEPPKIARCGDGDGDEAQNTCAKMLTDIIVMPDD
jgi:hypothetical protein